VSGSRPRDSVDRVMAMSRIGHSLASNPRPRRRTRAPDDGKITSLRGGN
jgi:hypothetical protein